MANNKDDVSAILREATDNYYKRLDKISIFKTIRLFDKDFYFLEKTNYLFLKYCDYYKHVKPTVADDTSKCFLHGYSVIDFEPAKNDTLALEWLKSTGLANGNTKKVDLNIAKILKKKQGIPIHRYFLRMILIYRGTYTLEEYIRDFDEIYLEAFTNVFVPIVPYSVLEECCLWAKEQRDVFKLKMEFDNQPEDLIKQIFD